MASLEKDLLDFEKAVEYMDPMQVTEYLQKILDFLNRNTTELCFPNISSYTEAFLVRLVTETKNLKSKSLNFENKKLAADIIDVLEMNRDVFRWTHAYECGKQNRNLLVYKKIFSNKLKMKPAEHKLPTSTISQRLAKARSQSDSPAASKIQLLNMTLRFIKDSSQSTLHYPEMPLAQAQYIYSLLNNPKSDLDVGFGYKSLCAPLFEALEAHGTDNVFEISFVETNKCDTASLKLEKKPRKAIKDSSREESSLSTSSTKKSNKKTDQKNPIKKSFITKTLKILINFTQDPERASVTFQQINDEQITFIKGMKTLAGNPESYGSLEQKFGDSLRQLNSNIIEVMKTCRLRIEEGVNKKNCRFLTVKKVPKEAVPSTSERAGPVTRSQSVPSKNSRDRSLSKERRIKFESGGKLDPTNPTADNLTPSATAPKTEQPKTTDKKERGRSTDRLNARKTKLLEDMSVPLESDRGIRMMLLMGWNGGALGARGDGILEPIVPSIELPPGAGLGHVPPPAPDLRMRLLLLQTILDMFKRNQDTRNIEFKSPLPKKERAFINNLLGNFNKRSMLSLRVREEVETYKQIMQAMVADVQIVIAADLDKDHKKITLTKSRNPSQKSIAKLISKLNKRCDVEEPSTMTVLTHLEYEVIGEESVNLIVKNVIPKLNTPCKTPAAIKNRATRILLLQRFSHMVQSRTEKREFRIEVKLQKRIDPFLKDVVSCVNTRGRSTYVTPEEMRYFEHLTHCSEGWILSLAVISATQFILSKKPYLPEYQKRFYNSTWPKPADNNNDERTNNKNQTESWAKNDDVVVISDDEEDKILTIVVKEEERKVKLEKVAKIETECDIVRKENDVNVKEVGIIKNKDVGIDKKNKGVGIEKKNKDVGNDKNNKALAIEIKKPTETDDELSDSVCVCDTDVDISELDKDIQDLELAIFEADLDFEVRKENSNISPTSKRSRSTSINSQETSTKRSKITINNCLIISPKDPEKKITTEIVKTIQTRISEEFDKCTYFLPLLKCHGIQKEGLVYSCHDENDVDWLEKIINDVDLDLKVCKSCEDFCIEQQSRKMVIKINSFIPLERKKFFERLETYNDGLNTAPWRVLAEQAYESFVFIIVDVDENSFKYISRENFALYVGIDKAQFSVI